MNEPDHVNDPPADAPDCSSGDEASTEVARASGNTRVSLRALYQSAMTAVNADPASAVEDYKAFLASLVEARRTRGD